MIKTQKNTCNVFNIDAIILQTSSGISSKFKKDINKYLTIKSKIIAAEARLPMREDPPWNPNNPPPDACSERLLVEKLKDNLKKEEEKIQVKWENLQNI